MKKIISELNIAYLRSQDKPVNSQSNKFLIFSVIAIALTALAKIGQASQKAWLRFGDDKSKGENAKMGIDPKVKISLAKREPSK
jgi:hypothetical protein